MRPCLHCWSLTLSTASPECSLAHAGVWAAVLHCWLSSLAPAVRRAVPSGQRAHLRGAGSGGDVATIPSHPAKDGHLSSCNRQSGLFTSLRSLTALVLLPMKWSAAVKRVKQGPHSCLQLDSGSLFAECEGGLHLYYLQCVKCTTISNRTLVSGVSEPVSKKGWQQTNDL